MNAFKMVTSAVLPRQVAGFVDAAAEKTVAVGGMGVMILLILYFGVLFACAFGASKLSYCYNIYIGNSATTAFFYSILAFFFAGVYYPFYGLFLNPFCSLPRYRTNLQYA